MSVLDDICARKRDHIEAQKLKAPLYVLKDKINSTPEPRGFIKALKNHTPPAIIAEVKKASPSVGIIRADFNAVEIAQTYEQSGAACLSVLTDEPYFQGRDEYLAQIRSAVKIPLLRKDFMLDEYQIFESRALGADCVLLIMAALDEEQAKKLYRLSDILGMDVLVEVHDDDELTRALKLNPAMIGINNRNLKTLTVDIETSRRLGKKIPSGILKIAESGISKSETIKELRTAGFNGFLIGESLMKEKDIGAAFESLTQTKN
jgi:indole-3-glycerol phosphate synthase